MCTHPPPPPPPPASINIFCVIAYERYRKVLHPLNSLQPRDIYQLYGLSWAAGALAASLVPAAGQFTIQPSGLYCNMDFQEPAIFGICIIFILLPLIGCVWTYVKVYQHIVNLGRTRVAHHEATRAEGAIAMKVMITMITSVPPLNLLRF